LGLLSGEVTGSGSALEADAIVSAVAEGTLLAGSAAAERDSRLAGEIPLCSVRVNEADMAFHTKWTVGTNGDGNGGLVRHVGEFSLQ
jgi:hypothetical protein